MVKPRSVRLAHYVTIRLLWLLVAVVITSLFGRVVEARQAPPEASSPAKRYSFVLFLTNGSSYSTRMYVNRDSKWSWNDLEALRGKSKEERLYVFKDQTTYLITDRATIESVKAAYAPVEKLGREQGALGRQQGELGRQQGELGRKQGELGRKQGELARSMAQSDEHQSADLEQKQRELGRQQAELGKQQEALGKKQSVLGRKQGELGRKQAAASAQAEAKITPILDAAFTHGLARPLPAPLRTSRLVTPSL